MPSGSNVTKAGSRIFSPRPIKVWTISGVNDAPVNLFVACFDLLDIPEDGVALYDIDGRVKRGPIFAGQPFNMAFGRSSGEPWDCRSGLVVVASTTGLQLTRYTANPIAFDVEYEHVTSPRAELEEAAEHGRSIGLGPRRAV